MGGVRDEWKRNKTKRSCTIQPKVTQNALAEQCNIVPQSFIKQFNKRYAQTDAGRFINKRRQY